MEMKKLLIAILIGATAVLNMGCGNDLDLDKYKEKTDWWSQAEEYNIHKEYSSEDIVYCEGEIQDWNNSIKHFYIGETEWFADSNFDWEYYRKNLPLGGKIRVVGECFGDDSFWIKDIEIIEAYGITLEDYIIERNSMDTNGISIGEALQLLEWCKENEDCMTFEKVLESSIFDLYPELNNQWEMEYENRNLHDMQ